MAKLTPKQVREAFDKVLAGQSISEVARALGVHPTTLSERCRCRYPSEYRRAQAEGKIRPGARNTLPDAPCPATVDYLTGALSLKEVAKTHQLPPSTLYYRVVKYKKYNIISSSERSEHD